MKIIKKWNFKRKIAAFFGFAIVAAVGVGFQNCSSSANSNSGSDLKSSAGVNNSLPGDPSDTSLVDSETMFSSPGPVDELEGYDIIVVGGQSNAVGFGEGDWSDTNYNQSYINSHIWQVGRASGCQNLHLENQIYPAADVLDNWNACKESFLGQASMYGSLGQTSAAMAFARRYYWQQIKSKGLHRDVIIVPAAYGGTNSHNWWDQKCDLPNVNCGADPYHNWTAEDKAKVDGFGGLLFDLVHKTHVAQNFLGKPNKVVAVLWLQGESDLALQGSGWNYWEWFTRTVQIFNFIKVTTQSEPQFLLGGMVPSFRGWDNSHTSAAIAMKQAMVDQAMLIPSFVSRAQFVSPPTMIGNIASGCDLALSRGDYPNYNSCSFLDSAHFTNQALVAYGDRFYQAYSQALK